MSLASAAAAATAAEFSPASFGCNPAVTLTGNFYVQI